MSRHFPLIIDILEHLSHPPFISIDRAEFIYLTKDMSQIV